MKLTKVEVHNYKSITNSSEVDVEDSITALVGQNESGKTAFLEALYKSRAVESDVQFDVTDDYPRKDLLDYEDVHPENPAIVTRLTYELSEDEVEAINADLGFPLLDELVFTHSHKYDNGYVISISIAEEAYTESLVQGLELSSDNTAAIAKSKSISDVVDKLNNIELTETEAAKLSDLEERFPASHWKSRLEYFVWTNHIKPNVPDFLYFDEYRILPGKVNLQRLVDRKRNGELRNSDRAVLRLLDVANIKPAKLLAAGGYEKAKARLEATSNKITQKVFKYWRQNRDLLVEFDVAEDSDDIGEFASGKNLYIRIKSLRHGVTVSFDKRSKGFIWFFSFLAWFDSIQKSLGANRQLILLLDEPGLNLHAMAQDDFLRYIETLATRHQILYTTHSPFMIDGGKLHRVRTVEDHPEEGTVVSSDVAASGRNTLFPLQAALGYSIAQNLFISPKALLVEGISDLAVLQSMSSLLEQLGRTCLDRQITITPIGGVKNVSAFVSLFGANDLDIVVLHDFEGKVDQKLENLVKSRLLQVKKIIHYAMFCGERENMLPADLEDLFLVEEYLGYFSQAFARELAGKRVESTSLVAGSRIVQRLNRYLDSNDIALRKSGGFNHYRVAKEISAANLKEDSFEAETLNRFEALFQKVNQLLK